MKIKFPDSAASAALTLCGQGKDEGSFAGTVPVTLHLPSGLSVTNDKLVKVSSSTSINKRGVRSGVIKVVMPYDTLMSNGNGGYVADPSRSGAELSVHVVVALPATVASDMRSSDATLKENAMAQTAAVAYILSLLTQGLLPTPLVHSNDDDSGMQTMSATPTAAALDSSSASIDGSATYEIHALTAGFTPTAESYQKNGGIEYYRGAGFPAATGNLLARIARSMPAIDGCSDVDVVYYQGRISDGE